MCLFDYFRIRIVTARKGVGLVCADYKGANARVVESGQNEDEISAEDEIDNDQSNIKTEKVNLKKKERQRITEHPNNHSFCIRKYILGPSAFQMKEKKCDSENDVCFAVWHVDSNGTQVIEMQGCWPNVEKQTACNEQTQCINNKPHAANVAIHARRYCCCTGHMCNVNLTERNIPIFLDSNLFSVENAVGGSNNGTLMSALKSQRLWIVVFIISIPMIVSLFYVALCRRGGNRSSGTRRGHPTKSDSTTFNLPSPNPNPKYSSDLLNVDNLKLCSMIGQGKYGTVWKGMINEQTVAVKLYPAQHRDYFLNEKDIYCLPTMDSPYFLEYFGCDERRTLEDNVEYLLVLKLAPFGSLQDWLTGNTATFEVYIKMARSIAGGLSHLHTAIAVGNVIKPCIAHRDFNSRNILVMANQTCCISDFGFALKTFGPRYEWKGTMTLAEQKSLNEVGTIRYFSPEILEGAVNLRDCETALKQTDIYSLGLVLWELYTRCHEFYSIDEPMPAYKQPYELEIGKMPSLEQMQILVSRQKVRPKFSTAWKRNVSAKIAKDTCEDCWDHDPDARLTALCVEERLREISTHRLQSPTVAENPTLMAFKPIPNACRPIHDPLRSNGNMLGSTSDDIKVCRQIAAEFPCDSKYSGSKLIPKLYGWTKIRSLINKRINLHSKRNDEMSILTDDNKSAMKLGESQPPTSIFQQSNLIENNRVHIKTKHLPQIRPKHLDLVVPHINTPDTTLLQPEIDYSNSTFRNYQSMYKRPPGDCSNQQFTIIDESEPQPATANANRLKKPTRLVVSKSANAMKSLQATEYPDDWQMKRQRSLEVFRDVFGVKGSIERLRDPSDRIKTPGERRKNN